MGILLICIIVSVSLVGMSCTIIDMIINTQSKLNKSNYYDTITNDTENIDEEAELILNDQIDSFENMSPESIIL